MIDSPPQLVSATDVANGAADPPSRQAATRIYVDQDGSGTFTYRLVDVATGRVLVELPRERVDELKSEPGYAAQALLSTSA